MLREPLATMGPPQSEKKKRPKRAAATQEARLAHMLGDSAELAVWLKNHTSVAANLQVGEKEKRANANKHSQADSQKKRKRVQMRPLIPPPSDDENSGDEAGEAGAARREHSPELSDNDSEYDANKDGLDGEESEDEDDDLEEEDDEELMEVEAPTQAEAGSQEVPQGAAVAQESDDGALGELLARIPKKDNKKTKGKKKNKDTARGDKNKGVVVPHQGRHGGRRSGAGDLVLNAVPARPEFSMEMLVMSCLRLQQAQADQLAQNSNIEKLLTQLITRSNKSRQSLEHDNPESAGASASVVEQAGVAESQLGLLGKLKANPQLLSSTGSPIKKLVSDAVNLSLLTSGVPDSGIMMNNTMLALRVGSEPEQEDLFHELYEDIIQPHQMDKFRQKRGQLVCAIRAEGTKLYGLPASGTEEWSKVTAELLAGDAYRREGSNAYGDARFRKVLAKVSNGDVSELQPLPDQIVTTLARVALVEVVLELLFRGVKRLDKPEVKMLEVREEALAKELRASDSVLVVAPEDPAVCPLRLQSRAAERARLLASQRATENPEGSPANENVSSD